jgi:hypothetical protein
MKNRLVAMVAIFVFGLTAGDGALGASKAPKPVSAAKLDALTSAALEAMKQRAAELKVGGVAVVAYAPGDTIQGWTSKMAVLGRMKDLPSATDKGANLLAIAYAKASEMADTHEDSGDAKRPPMTGEFGWEGGVIARTRTGFVIVAFSGGKSEDDVQISRAGLAVLKAVL